MDKKANIFHLGRTAASGLLMALLLAGCGAKAAQPTLDPTVTVETEIAALDTLTLEQTYMATVSADSSASVYPKVSAVVTALNVEVGDTVKAGDVLCRFEDTNSVGVSQAQAQLNYKELADSKHPKAKISGTISDVYVHNGDAVSAGSPIARIVSSNDISVDFLFPYASPDKFYVGQTATVFITGFAGSYTGTVSSVPDTTSTTSNGMSACTVRVTLKNPGNLTDTGSYTASAVIGSYTSYGSAAVSMGASATVYASGSGTVTGFSRLAGSTVKQGDVLCTIESESTRSQLKTAQLNLESARLSAGSAAGSLQDYTIKSPIAGTVIEKKFKAGDKVDGASSGTLAVIYDLSSLKMEMNVNELDIGKVAVGQTVDITANALPGQVFTGVVERVSINGSTTNGFTTYPVTISVQDYGDLKPGMNVSTVIHCETVRDVLTVPVGAVVRGGTVQLPTPAAMTADGSAVVDPSQLESRAVTLGRSDDEYIEVTSGLEEGDQVICPADGSGGDDTSSSAQLIG